MIGTFYHLLTRTSSPELTLMQIVGYDATTLGNHEFEWGSAVLAGIIRVAEKRKGGKVVPIVSSNIQFNPRSSDDDTLEELYDRDVIQFFLIREFPDGLKVGIIGLLGKNAEQEAPEVSPVRFKHNLQFIQHRVDYVRSRDVDLVICLSHSGLEEDKKLARSVKGIDVIIAGHCHTAVFEPISVDNTLIVEAGSYGHYLGKLELLVDEERVYIRDYNLIPVADTVREDKTITNIVSRYKDMVETGILNPMGLSIDTVLAESEFDLIGESKVKKIFESNLGNLVTDAVHSGINFFEPEDDVDFVFYPTGFLRGNLYRGKIRTSDVFRVLSMGTDFKKKNDYALTSFYLTAPEIKRILEISVLLSLAKRGDYLFQISGMRFWYNPLRENFNKVTRIEKWSSDAGEYTLLDISDRRTLYKVGMNLFLLKIHPFLRENMPGFTVIPKDKEGNALLVKKENLHKLLVDKKPLHPGIQELREWEVLTNYISSFSDNNGNLIPEIPENYREGEGRGELI